MRHLRRLQEQAAASLCVRDHLRREVAALRGRLAEKVVELDNVEAIHEADVRAAEEAAAPRLPSEDYS